MINSPKILSGNVLASLAQAEILLAVEKLKAEHGRAPGLGVVLVGNNPASQSYVKRKSLVAEKKCGFITKDKMLAKDVTAAKLSAAIAGFNQDPEIDGILLQLPLPPHLKANTFIDQIDPAKDADGLHPINQGLMLRCDPRAVLPCTPRGCLAMIDLAYSDFDTARPQFKFSELPEADLSGQRAVVVGRSILVGKPVGSLLTDRNATVTLAHSRTEGLQTLLQSADLVIAAVGVPKLVNGQSLKQGAIVIDVGINRTKEGKLVGDVDYSSAVKVARAITPVPGGVGPMTVAMLMRNTLNCFVRRTASGL